MVAMSAKKSKGSITNSRARFDYAVESTLLAGIELKGPEVKSLRLGHGVLRGAYVQVKDDGVWLINMQINPLKTNVAHLPETERSRTRRLLVKAKEIETMKQAKQNGRQIIPIKLLTTTRYIKLEIGIGKGKKHYDKRESIKKRDVERTELREKIHLAR
jgi:SsrA-binding protein